MYFQKEHALFRENSNSSATENKFRVWETCLEKNLRLGKFETLPTDSFLNLNKEAYIPETTISALSKSHYVEYRATIIDIIL